jgi:quinol-cytochrome oxidoreductase complex cytochrome b subunit
MIINIFLSFVASCILMVAYNTYFFPNEEIKGYNDAWFTFYILHIIVLSILLNSLIFILLSKLSNVAIMSANYATKPKNRVAKSSNINPFNPFNPSNPSKSSVSKNALAKNALAKSNWEAAVAADLASREFNKVNRFI